MIFVLASLCLAAAIANDGPWGWWVAITWLAAMSFLLDEIEAAPTVNDDGEWL